MSSSKLSPWIILTACVACYSLVHSSAYSIYPDDVYYSNYESLQSENTNYKAESTQSRRQSGESFFDVENRTDEDQHLANCRCINGTCEMVGRKSVCKCPSAFGFYNTSSFIGCKECNCGMDFNCTFDPGWFFGDRKKCLCKGGYTEFKGFCKGPCSPNPCKNNGICEVDGNNTVCFCPPFHSGRRCEIDLCPDQPCMNGGTCIRDTDNTFSCICNENYSGEKCEIDPCFYNPCKNGGTCSVEGFSFKCDCVDPFMGKSCEEDLCSSNPCLNGGVCKIVGKTFNCSCMDPYVGTTCQQDLCFDNPCKNGGMCKIDGKTFKCYCRDPFYGRTCENHSCSISPCKNGGTCSLDKDSFKCACKERYSGKTCEIVLETTSTVNSMTTSSTSLSATSTQKEVSSTITSTQDNSTTDRIDNIGFSTTNTTRVTSTLQSDGPSTTMSTENLPTSSLSSNSSYTLYTDTIYRKTPINNMTLSWPYFTESSTTKPPTLVMNTTTSTLHDKSSSSLFSVSPVTPSECNCGNKSLSCYFDNYGNQICSCLNGYAQKGNICAGICSSNEDCLNGGICKGNRRDVNFCECPWGFFGDWCERSDICENLTPRCSSFGAVCRRTGRTAKCECPPEKTFSWKSAACENICDSQKCQQGTCEIFGKTFICRCDKGYGGFHCDEKLNKRDDCYAELWFYILLAVVCLLFLAGSLYLIRTIKMLQRKTSDDLN